MASARFKALESTMRRQFWSDLIAVQMERQTKASFRASLVINARTGRPLGAPPERVTIARETMLRRGDRDTHQSAA